MTPGTMRPVVFMRVNGTADRRGLTHRRWC